MIAPVVQIFFATALLASARAETAPLTIGETYRLVFTDVDRHQLATADGHVTIIIVTTRQAEEKAQTLGDHVPDEFVGDPKYRCVAVINFQRKIHPAFQAVTNAIIRHRLDREAKRIQPRYSKAHLVRDPRHDLFAVADFDGTVLSRLGLAPLSTEFAAFIFDGGGHLLRRWNDVPSQSELAEALAAAKPR